MTPSPHHRVSLRALEPADADRLSDLETANRAYILRGGPVRPDSYVTPDGQRAAISTLLRAHDAGTAVPFVIQVDGVVVGRITISGIVRGPFHSGNVGYWLAEEAAGRGVATTALGELVLRAFGDLNLHRLQASTTPANIPSQRVLAKNGFTEIGLAPQYLRIGGRWQDNLLYQRINPAWVDPDA